MPFDWMNSGPGELNLAQPLQQGEQIGLQDAYRRNQLQIEANRETTARAALGLQSQRFDFEKNQWNAEAGARSNQLALGNVQLDAATRQNDLQTQDQKGLTQVAQDFSDHAANQDYDSILSASPGTYGITTPQGISTFNQSKQAALANIGGQVAQEKQTEMLGAKVAAVKAGISPVVDAQGNIDPTATNAAVIATQTQRDIATKGEEAKNSATVLAAQTKMAASTQNTETRAKASQSNVDKTTAASILNTLQKNHQSALNAAGGTLPAASEAAWQAQIQHAADQYNSARNPNENTGTLSVPGVGSIPVRPAYLDVINSITGGQ